VPAPTPWAQRTEYLADRSAIMASSNRDENLRRMIAERRRKLCLFFGSLAGGGEVGRTETRYQLRCKHVDNVPTILFVRFDNLH
jgi:hypothetical protein